ncbi:unnamed protein product [Linum trigynum]|uniref:Transposase n=1 Tax=Linum trigynum TaxID=586398 RepID=A0AAV2G1S7_9ROSI
MGPGGKRTFEYPSRSLTPRAGQKHAAEYANSYAMQYKRNKTGHNSRKVNSQPQAAELNVAPTVEVPLTDGPLGDDEYEQHLEEALSASEIGLTDQNRKKKKVRGITRGLETVKLAAAMGKEKFPITIDVSQGRPVNGVQSAKLSSELGLISREYMDEIPIRWTKDFKKNHLRSAYDRLNRYFEQGAEERSWVISQAKVISLADFSFSYFCIFFNELELL